MSDHLIHIREASVGVGGHRDEPTTIRTLNARKTAPPLSTRHVLERETERLGFGKHRQFDLLLPRPERITNVEDLGVGCEFGLQVRGCGYELLDIVRAQLEIDGISDRNIIRGEDEISSGRDRLLDPDADPRLDFLGSGAEVFDAHQDDVDLHFGMVFC